jgi:dihydroorotase
LVIGPLHDIIYADKLQIVKYDSELLTTGSQSGVKSESSFPSFIPKTDENRIQNITHAFETYKDMEFEEAKVFIKEKMLIHSIA